MMIDMEGWRQVLEQDDVHITLGQITKLLLADDRSVLRVQVALFPELETEFICRMSWEAVGPEAGFFQFPNAGDLVVLGIPDADEAIPFVISRLTSKEDKIPLNAIDGHTVLKALNGKKNWITSDTKILLSKGDDEPTENLVLGQVLKTFISDVLTLIIGHNHTSSQPGFPSSPPLNASDFSDLKSDPVDNEGILSDLAFTEKGD
jgi:hypothetical protein